MMKVEETDCFYGIEGAKDYAVRTDTGVLAAICARPSGEFRVGSVDLWGFEQKVFQSMDAALGAIAEASKETRDA